MRDLRTAIASTLDAQAHNDEQALLLFNATPEADSLMEHLAALPRDYGVSQLHADDLLRLCGDLHRSNAQERQHERTATGLIDATLRTALNGRVSTALGVKSFARAVRPLLKDLDAPGAAGVMARRGLHRLLRDHPGVAGAPSLANELGKTATARLHAEREAVQA